MKQRISHGLSVPGRSQPGKLLLFFLEDPGRVIKLLPLVT